MKQGYNHYLVRIQFLGFRYSGWQQQPNVKTVEGMLLKTLEFLLPGRKLKILGAGRTDAKVSALDAAFELFLKGRPILGLESFLVQLNYNLPADIKCVELENINENFNIIQHGKLKEYVYLFSFGEKNHPFCAPFMANILEELDIETMKMGASLFEGRHDFSVYTIKDHGNKKMTRSIFSCEIKRNTLLEANFFPKESYAMHISAKGFLRYQVRMIMGALIQLGKGELHIEDIKTSLIQGASVDLDYIAPGSGLLLNKLEFE